jgi:signal transduction histidine kinase
MMLLYMLLIAIVAWFWRKWYMKRQQRRLDAEILLRETEKYSWMAEMRRKMAEEGINIPEHQVVEQQQVELNLKQDDLVAYIKKICHDFKAPDNLSYKLSIVAAVDQLEVLFDAEALKQALYILFTNSVKFASSESRISVGIARMANGDAQLQIADNGIGVPEQVRETIFEPMMEGEGIGLDKVKAVIDAHHGTIRMEDNPGGGSIFFITLPAGDIVEEAEVIE